MRILFKFNDVNYFAVVDRYTPAERFGYDEPPASAEAQFKIYTEDGEHAKWVYDLLTEEMIDDITDEIGAAYTAYKYDIPF